MPPAVTDPWSTPVAAVLIGVATDPTAGLAAAEAARRLERDGPNELEAAPAAAWWQRLGRQFTDPLVVLLLVAIAISLVAWWSEGADQTPLEAVVIAAIVVLNAGIGFWQEAKAVAAVAALQRLSTLHTTVRRDGRVGTVPTSEVVVGDIVLLAEGDAVGADCRLIAASALHVAEAALTGESAPVDKAPRLVAADAPLAERANMVFGGTAVVRGRAEAVVVATGMQSQIGRIAAMLDQRDSKTPLQQQITWLGRVLGIAVTVVSALLVGAIVLTADTRSLETTMDALLVGVSLAVAAVPEGLPAIMSVVLALGVQRMARERAIVKRLSSVETLGSASVICTDKTGTLTRNEMTMVSVLTASGTVELTGVGYAPIGELVMRGSAEAGDDLMAEVIAVVNAGSLANDASLRQGQAGSWQVQGDPTEAAFLVAEQKLGVAPDAGRPHRVAEIPFSSERRRMTTVHRSAPAASSSTVAADRDGLTLYTKGAPDVILERCTHEQRGHSVVPLTAARRAEIERDVDQHAAQALRMIAVAYRPFDEHQLGPPDRSPEVPATGPAGSIGELGEYAERDLVHLGVVGLLDPPRPEVADAIAEAQAAGIRVVMITGDHPITALKIGESLGIHGRSPTTRGISGRELRAAAPAEFCELVRSSDVFARVEPEHKLAIVEALQADGEIVAMTGDGVNDAPALRRADIGVAMGLTGTEVSKEAADMILADDNFATILRAVREGREIFADIAKVVRYLLASNTGEVLVMVIGVLAASTLGLQALGGHEAVPLLATQILWINLLTDGALAIALGVDPAVENVMDHPPRRLTDRVIDREMLVTIGLIGVTAALAALIALDLRLPGGLVGDGGDIATARTMAFTTLVFGQVFNAFNARSDRVSALVRPFENRVLWGSVGVTVALQIAVVHVPWLQQAFDTAPLDVAEWSIALGLASAVLWVDEARKLIARLRRGG
ncbi:MAG TPA: cation-translocating P-type ATPase [Ilumatobacter sp.]